MTISCFTQSILQYVNQSTALAVSSKTVSRCLPLVATGLVTSLVGCVSQPLTTQPQPLYQSILQANQQLVGRQSYAFDYRVKLSVPPPQVAEPLAPTPNRQKLTQALITQDKLSSEQQALMQAGIQYKAKTADASQYLTAFIKPLELGSTGVIDLGRGQIALTPELRYIRPNAGSYFKLPLAADFVQGKVYADLSFLSEWVTDPQYDGRYVVYDYRKLFKNKPLNTKALFGLVKEFSLLNATLAQESDYQRLPVSPEDRQKGISQRIVQHVSYPKMIAEYLLFLYVNENHLKTLVKDIEINDSAFKTSPEKTLTAMAMSPSQLFKTGVDSSGLQTANDQAAASALRIYEAIEQMRESEADTDPTATDEANTTDNETADAQDAEPSEMQSTDTASGEATANEGKGTEDTQTQHSEEGDKQAIKSALAAFERYQTDKLVTAQQLTTIIAANPEAFAKLQAMLTEQSDALFGKNSDNNQVRVSYGLNNANQLLNVTAFNYLPSFDKASPNPTKIETVINFSDYGKARVNPAIFNNAVTWEQVTKQRNLLAISQQEKSFDSGKNLEALANSLLEQNPSFVDTFVTLYSYQYLLDKDETTLQDIDIQALRQTAKALAITYANEQGIEHPYTDTPDINEDYNDSTNVSYIGGIVEQAFNNQDYLRQIKRLTAEGKTQAQIFTALYNRIQNADVDDAVAAARQAAEDAIDEQAAEQDSENDTLVETTIEQDACSILLDSDKLDQKSLKTLTKLCAKIDKISEQQAATATTSTAMASTPVVMTQAELAKERAAIASFNQLLGKIAVEDMQTQAKGIDLADKDTAPLIEQLRPHFEASYGFDYEAYKQAYKLMLLSQVGR